MSAVSGSILVMQTPDAVYGCSLCWASVQAFKFVEARPFIYLPAFHFFVSSPSSCAFFGLSLSVSFATVQISVNCPTCHRRLTLYSYLDVAFNENVSNSC